MKTFAAIDVGSYELAMKIFEISAKSGIREIDHIRHRIDLGTDTYANGKISNERVDELCRVLRDYGEIMKGYRVDAYKAYGTSAIRDAEVASDRTGVGEEHSVDQRVGGALSGLQVHSFQGGCF